MGIQEIQIICYTDETIIIAENEDDLQILIISSKE